MRQTIQQSLVGDPTLTALVPSERWFQAGAVADRPEFPFVVVRWISPVRSDARSQFLHQLRIDVHDGRGDYSRIDRILGGPHKSGGVYANLQGIVGLVGVDGYVTCCDYLGDSGDQEDPDYVSNFMYSSWQVIGRSL
jgi:hypothetical protein